jgi:hypothetical protein
VERKEAATRRRRRPLAQRPRMQAGQHPDRFERTLCGRQVQRIPALVRLFSRGLRVLRGEEINHLVGVVPGGVVQRNHPSWFARAAALRCSRARHRTASNELCLAASTVQLLQLLLLPRLPFPTAGRRLRLQPPLLLLLQMSSSRKSRCRVLRGRRRRRRYCCCGCSCRPPWCCPLRPMDRFVSLPTDRPTIFSVALRKLPSDGS